MKNVVVSLKNVKTKFNFDYFININKIKSIKLVILIEEWGLSDCCFMQIAI